MTSCEVYTISAQYNGCVAAYVICFGFAPAVLLLSILIPLFDKKDRRRVTELPNREPGASLRASMVALDFQLADLVEPEPKHIDDALPANCPHCNGPVDPGRVKWVSKRRAKCAYCGSVIGR